MPDAPPSPPWHLRPRVLRFAASLLTLAVVAQGALLVRTQRTVDRLVARLDGIEIMNDLGLGSRAGLLLVVANEDQTHVLRDLRAVQVAAQAWLDDFAARQGLAPEVAGILSGVLTATAAAWGDYQVLLATGTTAPGERAGFSDDVERRCLRAVDALLAPDQARAFREEFPPRWESWTASARRDP